MEEENCIILLLIWICIFILLIFMGSYVGAGILFKMGIINL